MTPPLACRGWPVKLGQPDPGNAGEGGSSPDNVRDGSALSDGRVRQAVTRRCTRGTTV
jgi:hypothetical protein